MRLTCQSPSRHCACAVPGNSATLSILGPKCFTTLQLSGPVDREVDDEGCGSVDAEVYDEELFAFFYFVWRYALNKKYLAKLIKLMTTKSCSQWKFSYRNIHRWNVCYIVYIFFKFKCVRVRYACAFSVCTPGVRFSISVTVCCLFARTILSFVGKDSYAPPVRKKPCVMNKVMCLVSENDSFVRQRVHSLARFVYTAAALLASSVFSWASCRRAVVVWKIQTELVFIQWLQRLFHCNTTSVSIQLARLTPPHPAAHPPATPWHPRSLRLRAATLTR